MANQTLTVAEIAKEAAFQVHNQLGLAGRVHTGFEKEFGGALGDTCTYRKPSRYIVNDGMDVTSLLQDLNEPSDTITIDKWKNVAFKYNSKELALNIKDFSERHIKPGVEAIVNNVDVMLASLYKDVYQHSGTAGTTPSGFDSVEDLSAAMSDFCIPAKGRNLVLNPTGKSGLKKGMKVHFEPTLVKGILQESALGRVSNMECFESQNIQKHTAGDWAGTVLVAGAGQTGATLNIDGLTNSGAAQLKKGDLFTIASVYSVNPITKQSTGRLQQFTLTADATVTTGAAALAISPSIVTSGAHQNVTAGPADNAAITSVASHTANLAFHKNAFSLITVPIKKLEGGVTSYTQEYEGLAVTVSKGADIKTFEQIIRIDMLFGLKCSNANLAMRMLG